MKDYGRLDWKPRKRVWAVVAYKGQRDVVISEHVEREQALAALRNYVENRGAAQPFAELAALVEDAEEWTLVPTRKAQQLGYVGDAVVSSEEVAAIARVLGETE